MFPKRGQLPQVLVGGAAGQNSICLIVEKSKGCLYCNEIFFLNFFLVIAEL